MALISDPAKCRTCGADIEIWRPLRHLALGVSLLITLFSAAFMVKVRAYWPFAAGLLVSFALQVVLARWGRLVVVTPQESSRRHRQTVVGLVLLCILFVAIQLYNRF